MEYKSKENNCSEKSFFRKDCLSQKYTLVYNCKVVYFSGDRSYSYGGSGNVVPQQDLSSVSVGKLIPLYEFMIDHRSCTHNLSSCELKA